jgi:hypothetical protein
MTVPCVILGDSLAAGVAAYRPDCLSDTKIGISTAAYLRAHTISVSAETVVISLGVNDGDDDPRPQTVSLAFACGSRRLGSFGSCRLDLRRHDGSSGTLRRPSATG